MRLLSEERGRRGKERGLTWVVQPREQVLCIHLCVRVTLYRAGESQVAFRPCRRFSR